MNIETHPGDAASGAAAAPAPGLRSAAFPTAFGPCAIAWTEVGVASFRLPGAAGGAPPVEGEPGEPPPAVADAIDRVRRYFSGEAVDFSDVKVDLSRRSAADRAVYAALRRIGHGRTTTYGALAEMADLPGGARLVGGAMARNPAPVIIPCHRVLASGDRIGGFSAPGGAATKTRLLALEGVRIGPPETAQLSLFG